MRCEYEERQHLAEAMTNTPDAPVSDAMIAAGVEAFKIGPTGWQATDAVSVEAIYLAMQAAKPVPDSEVVEVLRESIINAWYDGARKVHEEWAKADEGERFYLSRDHEPDFTEAAHDYAAVLLAKLEGQAQ